MGVYLGANRVALKGGMPVIVEGIDTSDANAVEEDVLSGKIFYTNTGRKVGTHVCVSNDADLKGLIEGSITELTLPSDLTRIREYAFYKCENLNITEIPNTVTTIGTGAFYSCRNANISTIPSNVSSIGSQAFYNNSVNTVTFDGKPSTIASDSFSGCTNLTQITCPWYEGDVANAPWGASNATITYLKRSYAVTVNMNNTNLEYGELTQTIDHGSPLTSYTHLTWKNKSGYKITSITMTMGGVDYSLKGMLQLGYNEDTQVSRIIMNGANTIIVTGDVVINVITEEISSAPTTNYYTVDEVSGSTYKFELNSSGYYESNNKGVVTSYAVSKINLTLSEECDVTLTCINYAEANYDYGMLGKLDTDLELNAAADTSDLLQINFKSSSTSNEQDVVYSNVPAGNHYIIAKYIKDNSQDSNNDSLQFKVTITPTGNGAGSVTPSENSYTVAKEEDCDYEFIKDSDGWYVSNNKGISNSYAMSRITFNFTEEKTVKFTFINYGEASYDYGVLSKLDRTLTKSNLNSDHNTTDVGGDAVQFDGYQYDNNSPNEQETTYIVPSGSHFVIAKYKKDESGNVNSDCFKFKIQVL